MTVVSAIVIYFIIWWLVLFMVLPWGNRPRELPEPGHVPSAPANPRIWLKFAVTTGVPAILFLVVWGVIESG
jgi:predicted secreted protein